MTKESENGFNDIKSHYFAILGYFDSSSISAHSNRCPIIYRKNKGLNQIHAQPPRIKISA